LAKNRQKIDHQGPGPKMIEKDISANRGRCHLNQNGDTATVAGFSGPEEILSALARRYKMTKLPIKNVSG
jgi:hypothetical protein